ncbi:YhgE/Pip domain-containing protein [Weissella confusa]|mgnify:CR=1 FL=1|uniref:YhgE/Pip domain-containing protein n=1 Tax=Weissella confusa TaxID=1583 RepID=UPI001080E72B|nr:YhgE/Pip domain-containing protein [Weissella confusa]MBA5934309.1 YhgE/Pip domain-containing protein [Weissella confusa]MBF7056882.1 YhgE/Pip domain-containing protein [Weissella confusa]MBJ7637274.1 YhgE/Pip domain-containing protein [Weissella confusa]MBJ7654202.1 YhgE/Pip domain-containing protein [Weissella confusa]MBS6379243.1 YhgE/Pip domain-containing protein [Weissella confusa]
MFKAEWEYLKKHKFFMLVIVVLFFVPSIYAVTFLSSLWDPYGQVKNLPVAIINKDKSVTYEGQKLAVGDDLEKELRKSKDMDFHFPSEKEAKAGLKDGKYYTVITIPSDFSKDATTLLDKDPKQMKLDYETSSGHSFIAGKLSESGAKEISQQISKQVTKTYAKTIFAEMKKVGKGMNTAADANKQLADGTTQIKSGSDQLTSGLQTLSASTLQFNGGAQTLTQGLSQYVDGVAQADSGSQQVTAGLSQLNSQVPALVGGVGQLATGSQDLATGVQQYTDGVTQAATGSEQITNGVDQLNQKLKDQDLAGKITTLQTQIATLQDIAKDMPSQSQIQEQLQTAQSHLDNLAKANATDAAAMPANVDKAFADAGVQVTPEQKAKIAASLTTDVANSETSKQIEPVVKDIETLSAQIVTFNNAHGNQIQQLADSANKTSLNDVNNQLEQLKVVPTAINTLDGKMHELTNGLDTLVGKSGDLTNGATKVSGGLDTLNGKTGDLSNGASQLLAGSSQLTTGLDTLNSKRGELSSGAGQLADGARKLNGGANQLTAGAEQLSPALAKVQAGNQTLADKMGSAAKQVNDTKATNKTFKQIAAPATAKQTEKDHVANNGTGMVPYMFSVAMFVGMMALNLMLDMISPRTKISSLAAWMGSKMVMLFGIAVMAATVLYGLSISILGLDPIHPLQTYGFMILISLMDAALVTAIYMWFDKAGAFAAMVLLVFQLSGSAGTYPIQLSNAFFEWLHPYLPMTYTVDGLRETIMIGGSAMPQVEVLFSVFVVSVIAMVIYYASHRRHYSMMQDIAEA